ncbi:YgaP family membrane protein [Hydrogenimonas sp.]
MCNEGKIDRIVRVVLGLAIIGWGVAAQNWWGAVGLVPLLTGAIGFCPLYLPFKIDTGCKVNQSDNEGA